ncbi:HNH endonuclease [Lichenibacterium ramalinae]|uniref:HNH endonuclease n=1 Tax=Lichenibacterium ramalinae TaxID=2316527 RepID=A0A4Q2R4G9_9HYPH|nr:HNH endonuclease [Lichenibacterium ramalinae]RYB01435.1 HNH endonuclease [Lichenibacterium ramalinae]
MRLDFCVACGERDPEKLEHHHLVPRSAGGEDADSNLITLCHVCHGRAHGFQRANLRALTRNGIAKRKARGEKVGRPENFVEGRARGVATNKATADAFASNVLPIVREIQASGKTTLQAIANALNARKVATARGGEW